MEVDKRSGEKKGGVKLGGLGGGGLLLVVGGALVAATMWTFREFRRRKPPSCKKGTLKDLMKTSLEKVKNVDDGGDGVGVILKNSKLLVDGSEIEEKDTPASNLLLDAKKSSKLGVIEEGEEFQEGKKFEENGCHDANMALYQKKDGVVCEAVHKKTHKGIEFCDDVMYANDVVAASEHDRIMLVEKTEPIQFAPPEIVTDDGITYEKKDDEVVQFMISNPIFDDGSNDAVSQDLEYEGEETSDSSTDSINEAAWPVYPSSEPLPQDINCEKKLHSIQTEIVEVEEDESEKISSANSIYNNASSNGNDNGSIHKEGRSSTSKDQMMVQGNSTNTRIWVSAVLVALLVLLGALMARHKYFSPALAEYLSSINYLRNK